MNSGKTIIIVVAIILGSTGSVVGRIVPEQSVLIGEVSLSVEDFPEARGWAEIILGSPTTGTLFAQAMAGGEFVVADCDCLQDRQNVIIDVSEAIVLAQQHNVQAVDVQLYLYGGDKANTSVRLSETGTYGLQFFDHGSGVERNEEVVLNELQEPGTQSVEVFPNPFNPTVAFRIPRPDLGYNIRIYSLSGRLVIDVERDSSAAEAVYIWNGRDGDGSTVPSGTYLYSIVNGQSHYYGKVTMVK